MNTWSIIIGVVGGLGGLIIIFKFIKWVYHYFRPKLMLYYNPSQTYDKVRLKDLQNVWSMWVHIIVKNTTSNILEGCVGELVDVKKFEEGKWIFVPKYENAEILKWSHESDFKAKSINPKNIRKLDIAFVLKTPNKIKNKDFLYFETKTLFKPTGSQSAFSPGKYKITVQVKAKKAKPVSETFIIEYQGNNWESLVLKTGK